MKPENQTLRLASNTENSVSKGLFNRLALFAQVIWFGAGLTLLADTVEILWRLPHSFLVMCSAMLMVMTSWLSTRAVGFLTIGMITLLFTTVCVITIQQPVESSSLHAWAQMLSTHFSQYMNELMTMVGTLIVTNNWVKGKLKGANIGVVLLYALLIFGGLFEIYSGINRDITLIILSVQCTVTLFGSSFLRKDIKTPFKNKYGNFLPGAKKAIPQLSKNQLRIIILVIAVVSALCSDLLYYY